MVYLFLLLLILYWNREKVVVAFEALTARPATPLPDWKQRLLMLGAAGAMMGLLFLVELFWIRRLG